jgi:L-rhamnose isomerase
MKDERILKNYEHAKAVYGSLGVDVDAAVAALEAVPVSLHCWQGDDVKGFEGLEAHSENLVTGNYPGAARNGNELRADIDAAFSLSPLRHKVNLHSMYAERKHPRNDLTVEDFRSWVEWANANRLGLDFNASFFTHPMMNEGFSLASLDKSTRDYWIKAGQDARAISVALGRATGQRCYNNIWVPDGLKDVPANRFLYRALLTDSLDQILAKKYTAEEETYAADVLEGKLFGIGTECFVVGSHDFYIGYAATHGIGVCMDTGHYHPTESIVDKISAVRPFVKDILLHLSRGIRWDSDHVLTQGDDLTGIFQEVNRGKLWNGVGIGLDYFDASINRVAAWSIGLRAAAKAMLYALLEPVAYLFDAEKRGDFTARLLLSEEFKSLPHNAVWEYVLLKKGIPSATEALDVIKAYEKKVLATRK